MNIGLQRRVGFTAWGSLALLQIVWHAWLLPPVRMPIAVALIFGLLPLAIPLLYWRTPARALLLAGMICLFYFCHGVAEAYAAPAERVFAMIEIALAVIVILACARMPKPRRDDPSPPGRGGVKTPPFPLRAAPGEGTVSRKPDVRPE